MGCNGSCYVLDYQTVKPKSFSFSPENVTQVKQRYSKFLHMFQPSSFISTNNIMIAILGISVARVQHPVRASNNEDARVTMKVDLRSRVQPPLPYTYVGNMTFPVQGDIYPPQNHQIEVENAQKADILRLTQVALQLRGKLVR